MATLTVAFMLMLALASVAVYLMARVFIFVIADYEWYEKVLALALLLAEAFLLLHTTGYLLNVWRVMSTGGESLTLRPGSAPELTEYPPVAVVVSSYKEPLSVIEDTLTCFYNMTYPNKQLYFLDDTRYDLPGQDEAAMAEYRRQVDALCKRLRISLFRRKWRGAKAGMINDFLDYVAGQPKDGCGLEAFGCRPDDPPKYIIVFDADQNPFPDFAEPLVAFMEQTPRLAFIQTPQYYTNFETNRVARASGLQQAVFYEYICEGKGTQDTMFLCGTNVIIRREALTDVGGFDEASVTEDFATSLKLHKKGWRSAYYPVKLAFGMGPEDLGGYFKQQFRWALGTVGIWRKLLGALFTGRGRLTMRQFWEYGISGTYYFIGWVFFVMMLCPMLYIFFGVPTYFARPEVYLLFFAPYVVLTLSLFFYTLGRRRYRFGGLLSGITLQTICFPVYMSASLLGILGVKGRFGITPKGGSLALPLSGLWPQVGMALLSVGAVSWGICRLWYEGLSASLAVNIFWCLYHFTLLSVVLWFNNPEGK